MPIVECPKCKKHYDPGVDEALLELPPNTSLKVVCPGCGQWLRLPQCETIPPPDAPPEVLKEMMAQSRLVEHGAAVGTTTVAKPWWKFW